MGFIFGLVKRLIKLVFFVLVFAAIIVLIPNLPPYAKFSSIEIEPTLARTGPLAPNTALNNAQRLHEDKVLGPEAFELWRGELYTGLATGEIVKVSPGGHITFVTKVGRPCTGLTQDHICGRPLGIQIDEKAEHIYIADPYLGIWRVDLKTDKKQLLVSPSVGIEGRQPKLINTLTLDKNGDLYYTDSSSDFQLRDGMYTSFVDPTGRLLHYNAAKNQSKVLLDGLWFANGIAMSPDKQFVVVSETFGMRLIKYYVNGPNKGKSETFIAGLPGLPDNLRALPDGSGVLIALYNSFDEDHPIITKSLAQTPVVRKFLARVQRLVEIPFEFLNTQFPNVIFEDIIYKIGHFKTASALSPGSAGLLHVDWNGNILESYFNTDGTLDAVSDAVVYNDKLYLGSPHANYFGAINAPPALKKAFASVKQSPPKAPEPKEVPQPKVEVKQEKPVEAPKDKLPRKEPVKVDTPKIEKKVEQKPKVESKPEPKVASKPESKMESKTEPKVEQKPKVESKPEPKVEQKPKVVSKPESKVESKTEPKVDSKPTPAPPTTPPRKEPEVKTTPPKPTQPVPKEQAKPTPSPSKAPKTEEPKIESTTPEPATETPKAKQKLQPPRMKIPEVKRTKPVKQEPDNENLEEEKVTPMQIPIVEDIPVDTVKPSKDKLKVIKKSGPTEIPNPAL